jgi:transposase InsO family protein
MINVRMYPREFGEALVVAISLGSSTIAQVSKGENIAGQTLRNWMADRTSCKTARSGYRQRKFPDLPRNMHSAAASLFRFKHVYNTERPHSSLGNVPPAAFRREFEARSLEKGLQFYGCRPHPVRCTGFITYPVIGITFHRPDVD